MPASLCTVRRRSEAVMNAPAPVAAPVRASPSVSEAPNTRPRDLSARYEDFRVARAARLGGPHVGGTARARYRGMPPDLWRSA